ncbi:MULTISPECIES: C1 family peptidase [unclassified Enterococcus]|uniref:C1 family peptidase n=1 Tax=unclassified Enterococcus TaxID=2608891 RepID=UPI00155501EF|nr:MULTISPECIES: C1 family peptidase [unclassified Enterococcus]MBS7576621.1 C1 family peptidase [Enterococcus sp. MMGLQ5-2]MBS7583892.1 C1 family peptidase [Enterococcus sp. MMGLQ5-1]NPD11753.1 aminopeptidase [Enterococcus sp. MMGLQ5-1]NPD36458.1 aminopeptidase [Enterococcus sp. MMGLQ5-2]
MDPISKDLIKNISNQYQENDKYRAVENAITKNGILNSIEQTAAHRENLPIFSVDVKTGPVTNQKQSGRCWMFAAMNTFRHRALENLKLKEFEFSQSYTFFWDKFEKSNWFFDAILSTADQPLTDRTVKFLLDTPQQDGGQWDMMVSIFQKYGVVPKSIYPESVASSSSRELNQYLNKLLRQGAERLRRLVSQQATLEQLTETKTELLTEVYHLLSAALGTPPETFDFEYRDDDSEYHRIEAITPTDFYQKFVGVNLDDYVSIINAPTEDKPFHQSFTVELLGNVVGGKEVKYLNLPMSEFKALAIQQLKSGESVWFGCDVGQFSNRKDGIMSMDIYDFKTALDIEFTASKGERLNYSESLMTHAMVLTGVDLVDEKPIKWKVENSWGDKVGDKGFFVASDQWMDEYTYQIVIHKKFLSAQQLLEFEQAPEVLTPWDPMGALA